MKTGQVILSKRLQMLADMVTAGNCAADVGCDHGFLAIYLVQKNICPRVLAMDVRHGPLNTAREHIEDRGLGAYIETRLSDGIRRLETGEADTVVCAGMGGRLMQSILSEDLKKTKSLRELILQPQSEIKEFRSFLRREGFRIEAEDAVCEGNKYYFAMKAVYAGRENPMTDCQMAWEQGAPAAEFPEIGEQEIFDEYGRLLLRGRHPVLHQYLLFRRSAAEALSQRLEAQGSDRTAERLLEVRRELAGIEKALGWFRENNG